MFLTAAILKSKRACVNQLALFSATFPEGVEVTPEVCVSVADKFDWNWAAANLLPPLLVADFDAKRALLVADYYAKRAPMYADFDAKRAPMYADYTAKVAPLQADYDAKRALLVADYDAKVASLFGELAVRAALSHTGKETK